MGRPRKSLEDHVRDGTYRADRHGPLPSNSGETVGPSPKRPAYLTGRAAKVWDEAVATLAGEVGRRDAVALAEYARWVERAERAAAEIDALPDLATVPKSLIVLAGIAADKIAVYSARFRLTPADRAKMKPVAPAAVQPKVRVRPQTALDRMGRIEPPKPKE